MSQAATHLPVHEAIEPDSSAFLPIDEAARLLGVSVGHLRRQGPKLAAEGLAAKAPAPEGVGVRWWIHRHYNPRLAAGAAFAAAMQDQANLGGPEMVYLDNGKDYACYAFHGSTKKQRRDKVTVLKAGYMDPGAFGGLFGLMQIGVVWAQPYNARAKGRLEKWFHYGLHEDFDKAWPSYAGNKPENRPEGLDRLLKDKAKLPTFEQIREAIGPHIAGFNSSREHGFEELEGCSPDEAYQAWARRRQFADPGVIQHFMLTYSEPVRVHRNGVTIRPLGKAIQYGADAQELVPLKGTGRLVRVGYDQNSLSRAWVFDENMTLICQVRANDPGLRATDEVGRDQLGKAIADQRRVDKAAKVVREEVGVRLLSTQTLAAQEARKQKQQRQESEPQPEAQQPVRLVQTPLDGQARRFQQEQLRQAAGAETASPQPSLQDLVKRASQRKPASKRGAGQGSPQKPAPSLSSLMKRRDRDGQ